MSRLKFFYTLVIKMILGPVTALKYNVTGERIVVPKGPSLIISNHVTNIDYMIIGHKLSCHQAHYVMAENAARNPFIKNALMFLDEPIIHFKGSNALSTVREMHKRFKKGNNVMLFPEGNTSFDGTTAFQDDSVGKLAKLSNANLVLTRIEGGYLSRPRWGTTPRRGRINVVGKIIPAEEVKKMSVGELTEVINSHIYTDAYERQQEEKVAFKGKKKALGLERAIYLCPGCKSIGGLSSDKDQLICKCGYKAKYDDFGYLQDESFKNYSINDILSEQKDWLKSRVGEIFTDEAEIIDVTDTKKQKSLGRYEIKVFDEHIEYQKVSDMLINEILLESIENVAIFKANTLTVFVKKNGSTKAYEIKGGFSFNALKYRDLFEINNK